MYYLASGLAEKESVGESRTVTGVTFVPTDVGWRRADLTTGAPSARITLRDGAARVRSDRAAYLSVARGGFAGHILYTGRGKSAGRGALGEEIEAPLRRRARAADLRARVLRCPRAPGVGPPGCLRGIGVSTGL